MPRIIPRMSAKESDRFWKKVEFNSSSGCWDWTAYINKWGYGTFGFSGDTWLVHRVSWTEHNGPIPEGLLVCHHCDNPKCVRPDHLFLGTDKDNSDDKRKKGRWTSGHRPRGKDHWCARIPSSIPRGERNGHAKITDDDVRFIRKSFKRGVVTYKMLGEKFGMDYTNIRAIVKRRTWRHID